MDKLNIEVPKGCKITVMGDCHGHDKQFFELLDKIKPSHNNWFVSVGDIMDKGFGKEAENKVFKAINDLVDNNIGYFIKGNHEAKHIRKNKKWKYIEWADKQPLALSFKFVNGTRLTVVHGGVLPKHTWNDLRSNNTDILYIRTVDENGEYIKLDWVIENGEKTLKPNREGKVWHEYYDGRFGYIASGHHAQKDGVPKFYKYSCNLDSAVYYSGILTAQVFSERGLEEMLQVTGPAARPNR